MAPPSSTTTTTLTTLLSTPLTLTLPPPPTDPLSLCPPSTTSLLPTRPAPLIKLAHAKIHSYTYSEVPPCWRRLYTDASIWEAGNVIRAGVGGGGGVGRWVDDAVRLLDMAVIIAGAPGREEMVQDVLGALEGYVGECGGDAVVLGEGREGILTGEREGGVVPVICRPVGMRMGMSMVAFEGYLGTGRPLVIEGVMARWPAMCERPWKSRGYLLKKTFGGRRLVPVEVGRSYTDEGWGQRIVTFGEFVDGYLMGEDEDGQRGGMGYLAQHDLFTQIPSLRNDVSIPDYCYTDPPPPAPGTPLASKPLPPKLDEPMLNAWFGPAGTVSPLHTDPYHNILCQVVGRKYVRLYAPEESKKVYPKGVEGGGVDMSNTSEVDVENVDEERWPLFREAEYVECILEDGECLYIPVGWWHYVRSLTVSFSVSFWWN